VNPRLHARLLHLCDLAKATPPEHDVGPALNALGFLLWSAATGDRDTVDAALSKRLKQLAGRAQLALRGSIVRAANANDEDAAITNATLIDIVRAASLVLDRKSVADATPALRISKLHPPSRTFARMLEGNADGLTTGRYALHILDCTRCQHTLASLPARDHDAASASTSRAHALLEVREPMMRFAAADTTSVRAPNEGRVVGRKAKPPLEAVLFNDPDARRLAIYSTDDINIRILADGLTTEATLTGYCLTRLDNTAITRATLDATLHLNDKPLTWKLALSEATSTRTARRKATKAASRKKPAPKKR